MKIKEKSVQKAIKRTNRLGKPRRYGALSRHERNQIVSRRRLSDLEYLMTLRSAMTQLAIRREQLHLRLGSHRQEPESPVPNPAPDLE